MAYAHIAQDTATWPMNHSGFGWEAGVRWRIGNAGCRTPRPSACVSFQRQEDTTKDTKSTKVSENESLDAVLEFGYVKVDQQARLDACQFHVGQLSIQAILAQVLDGPQWHNRSRVWKDRRIPSFVLFVSFVVTSSDTLRLLATRCLECGA
jgi:hypothetical protein